MESNGIHIHKFNETVVAPTCKSIGYTLHKCDCGYEHKDNFKPVSDHSWVLTEEVAPTCLENGYRKYCCSYCSETKTDIIHNTGHKWSNWSTQKFSTCTEAGSQIRICELCGIKEEQPIAPLGHKHTSGNHIIIGDETVEFFCDNCGEIIRETLSDFNDRNMSEKKKRKDKKTIKKPLRALIIAVSSLFVIALVIMLLSPILAPVYHYYVGKMMLKFNMTSNAYYQFRECEDFKDTETILKDFSVIYGEVTATNKALNDEGEMVTKNIYVMEYDKYGNCTQYEVTNSAGVVTYRYSYEYQYYSDGSLLSAKQYDYDSGEKELYSLREYDENGNIKLQKYNYSDGSWRKTKTEFDKNDNVIKQTVSNCDEEGKLTVEVDEYTYDYEYDDDNNLIHYSKYDEDGNILSEKSYYSDGEIKEIKLYDSDGNLTDKTTYDNYGNETYYMDYSYDGSKEETKFQFEYNDDGEITSMVSNKYVDGELESKIKYECVFDSDGNCSEYSRVYYDENLKITRVIERINQYDDKGNCTGTRITTSDGDNELISKTKYKCEYDGEGNIIKEVLSEYDDNNELTKKYRYEYKYDDKKNLSSASSSTYNEDGELTSKTEVKFNAPKVLYHPDNEDSEGVSFEDSIYIYNSLD